MKNLPSFFYSDSFAFGILLAIALPLITFIPIYPLFSWMKSMDWIAVNMPFSKYLIFSCIPNIIVLRQYFKVLQLEKTGKAMFVVTLVELTVLLLLSNWSVF